MTAFRETVRAALDAAAAKRREKVSVVYAFGGWDDLAGEAVAGGACIVEGVSVAEAARACAGACVLAEDKGWPRGCPVIVDGQGRRIAPGLS